MLAASAISSNGTWPENGSRTRLSRPSELGPRQLEAMLTKSNKFHQISRQIRKVLAMESESAKLTASDGTTSGLNSTSSRKTSQPFTCTWAMCRAAQSAGLRIGCHQCSEEINQTLKTLLVRDVQDARLCKGVKESQKDWKQLPPG